MTNELIPITDEQAKAIQEFAKTTDKAMDLAGDAGRFVGSVIGTVLPDLIGVLGGDTESLLRRRKVETKTPVSMSVAMPLFEAAAAESREEILRLWAHLLAARWTLRKQIACARRSSMR